MKNPVKDKNFWLTSVVKGSDSQTKDIAQVRKRLKAVGLPDNSLDAEKRRQQSRDTIYGVSFNRAWFPTFRIARTGNEKSSN